MRQAKVKNGTVGFLREDADLPFINLHLFETMKEVYTIPHYWRDRDGRMSHLWHLDSVPKNTKVTCQFKQRGMKHTFWCVTDPESDLVGKVFIVGFRFNDRIEDEKEFSTTYENSSPLVKYSLFAEKFLTKN